MRSLLLVPGDIRYLSGDLLDLLYHIANKNAALAFEEPPFRTQVLADNNAVFNLCCRLCSAYERKAFIDGLQYGAHLLSELRGE